MIRSFRIENFRCLRDVTVSLGSLTVIIGKNDTGKSSFLDAISYLSGIIPVGAQGYPDGFSVNDLAWRGAEPLQIGWTIEMDLAGQAFRYALSVAPSQRNRRFQIVSENLKTQDREDFISREPSKLRIRGWKGEWDETVGDVDEFNAIQFGLRSKIDNPHKQVGELLQEVKNHKIEAIQVALASLIEPNGTMTIAPDGSGVASFLDTLLNQDRDAFLSLEQELTLAIPEVKNILLKNFPFKERGQNYIGKTIAFRLRSGHEIGASQASSGLLLYLAYLCLLYSPASPRLLLIEEPENGIHPRQLQRVAQLLKKLTDPAVSLPTSTNRKRYPVQVVLATHSPYLLDFVPPESVVVFGRKADNGETVAASLLELPGVQERLEGGYSLGEMWFNVGEDALLEGRL